MVWSWRGEIAPNNVSAPMFKVNSILSLDVDGLIVVQGSQRNGGFGDDYFGTFSDELAKEGWLGHPALPQPKITVATEQPVAKHGPGVVFQIIIFVKIFLFGDKHFCN